MADEQEAGGESQPNYSPVEQQALEQGWVPKEEYSGAEHEWVAADEFLRRGELFDKIGKQSKRVRSLENDLEQLKAHYTKVEEAAYNRAIAELRKKKREALVEGDADAVIAVEDEIEELKESKTKPVTQKETSDSPHPEFVAWVDTNKWYSNDVALRGAADAIGNELAKQGMTPNEVLKEVSKRIKEEFPSKFRNPNRDKVSGVESGDKAATGASTSKKTTLTAEETRVMENFVRRNIMTKEQYIDSISKIKERS